MEFWQGYTEQLGLFELELKSAVETKFEQYICSDSFSPTLYSKLFDAVKYLLYSGGKRLRPMLLLEFARIFGADIVNALSYAVALELIHTYSLIHDDLPCMDNALMRRGMQSVHIRFSEPVALLAGDALLNMAYEIMFDAGVFNVETARIISNNCGLNRMVGGQFLELDSIRQLHGAEKNDSAKLLFEIYRGKTSGLFVAACAGGASLADTTKNDIKCAEDFGSYLGILFQIADDYNDINDDSANIFHILSEEDGINAALSVYDKLQCALNTLARSGHDTERISECVDAVFSCFNA